MASTNWRRACLFSMFALTTLMGLLSAFSGLDDPYGLSRSVQASTALYAVGPVCAAYGAARSAALVDVWGRLSVNRPLGVVLAERLAPPIAFGFGSLGIAFAARAGFDSLRSHDPLMLALIGVVGWSVFGAAVGVWVTRLVAVPVALVVPFLAMGLPGAMEPLWIRHLTGALANCCSTSFVLSPQAVRASLLAYAAVTVASLVALAFRLGPPRPRWSVHATGVAVSLTAFAVAVAQASQLDAFPVTARAADQLVCEGSVCVWPEDVAVFDVNAEAIVAVERAWVQQGLPLGDVRYGPVSQPGMAAVTSRSVSPSAVVVSVATQFPRAVTKCESYGDASLVAADEWLVGAMLEELGVATSSVSSDSFGSASEAFAVLQACG